MDDNKEDITSPTPGQSSEAQTVDEEDETITMLDVLQEEQDLEENAFAVLAGSDDKNCTYLKGYVSRQALYACNTCKLRSVSEEPTPSAAICLACSYNCHDGHDLIELYTKRHFRCDCGNDKFVDNKCKLIPKSSSNEKNRYNHNFDGLYCVCLRPYPDPDNDCDDSMIQCVVCEDWFHGRHLQNLPEDEDFAEMVCKSCMNRLSFLWYYQKCYEKTTIEKTETEDKIEIISGEKDKSTADDSGVETSCDSTDSSSKSSQCKLEKLKTIAGSPLPEELMPSYWPLEWRKNLCVCKVCVERYAQNDCIFLTDEKDSVHYYETQSRESNTNVSDYEKGLSELKKMDRIQQIEYINEYNDLKNSLQDYFQKFAKSGEIVKKEDILEFFQEMSSRKRQKLDIPFNCK